jgi:hypothetical protein
MNKFLGTDHPGGEEWTAAEPAQVPEGGSRQHPRRPGDQCYWDALCPGEVTVVTLKDYDVRDGLNDSYVCNVLDDCDVNFVFDGW